MKKRLIAWVLCLAMVGGMLPALTVSAQAATNQTEEEANRSDTFQGQDSDVFSALGFDTTVLPEGYDGETTDNPYGRDKLPGNQVFELLVAGQSGLRLYGEDDNSLSLGELDEDLNVNTSVPEDVTLYAAATGDFDGDGLAGEVAYVGLKGPIPYASREETAELVLFVYNPKTETYSDVLTLGSVSPYYTSPVDDLGIEGYHDQRERQTKFVFAWQNLLQIATGDFDGDGLSEIAVYVGENGADRVDIYKFQKTSQTQAGDWMNMGNGRDEWRRVWSRALSYEDNAVPNMVSVQGGDFNRDGVDDLAVAFGSMVFRSYYLRDGASITSGMEDMVIYATPSTANVLWGSTSNMLQNSSPLDLNREELGELARVGFTYGDVDGDGTPDLVAAGQPLNNGSANTQRSILTYLYDEELGLTVNASGTFAVVDGEYVTIESENSKNETVYTTEWRTNNTFDERYRSKPYMHANAAVITPKGCDYTYIYVDSVLYQYYEGQMQIAYEMDEDNRSGYHKEDKDANLSTVWGMHYPESTNHISYSEFGAVSGDINGQGFDILATNFTDMDAADRTDGADMAMGYGVLGGTGGGYVDIVKEQTGSTVGNPRPLVVSMPDVDLDTVLIEYTGIHYLTYSDPKVLAIIAAAPYFEDVDVISDYDYAWQNTTSYSRIKGEGHTDVVAVDLEAGVYVEAGITTGGARVQIETSRGFTLEWEKTTTKSTAYTLTFETSQDEDAVAFFSIPTENYVYKIYTPNGQGGYDVETSVISNTFTPSYQVLNLDYYESIQGNYDALPQIAGTALTSQPGSPSSYPSSSNGYDVIAEWNDYPAGVSFGNGSITQEIEITRENTVSKNMGAFWDFKIGGGAGFQADIAQTDVEITGGAQWSLNPTGGWVDINLEGTVFSGTVTNMPLEFQDYGYYYSWKLFAYNYTFSDGTSIPVVSYLVNDVSEPPKLPDDFQQDFARSTSSSNVLTWTYEGDVRYFYIYKYSDFPDGGGLKRLATILPGDSAHYRVKYDEQGRSYREYFFVDENLAAYTEYQYAIQVERLSPVPPLSAPSGLLTVRTKAEQGYPALTVSESDGANDGQLLVYPDTTSYLTALATGPEGELADNYYATIQYQWQKLERGAWTDMVNETAITLTFAGAGVESAGSYRCRVNVQVKSSGDYISAYTDAVTLQHAKRTAYLDTVWVRDLSGGGVELYAKVNNAHGDSASIPGGIATFTLTRGSNGDTYQFFIELDATGVANKALTAQLPEDIYSVYVYYSGSYIFKACEDESAIYLSQRGSGYSIDAPLTVTYGDGATIRFRQVEKQAGVTSYENTPAEEYAIFQGDAMSTRRVNNLTAQYNYNTEDPTVTAGESYSYTTLEGAVYYFTATRTGAVTFQGGYALYDGGADQGYLTAVAGRAGEYTLAPEAPAGVYAVRMVREGSTVYAPVTIAPRPITLALPVWEGEEGTAPPRVKFGDLTVVAGSWASCDMPGGVLSAAIAAANVPTTYYNTAGVEVPYSSVEDLCGFYYVRARGGLDSYQITYQEGSVSMLGGMNDVTVGARQFEGLAVGTVYAVSPKYGYTRLTAGSPDALVQSYATGTRLVFTAVPDDGYEVYNWYINGVAQDTRATSIAYVLLNEATRVEVQFAIKQNTLTFGTAGATQGGELICENDAELTSGSVVLANAGFRFVAQAKEGYHFKEWRYTLAGAGTQYDATDEGLMSSTFDLVMPTASCSVFAVFERDFYTFSYEDLNGGDGLVAWYMGSLTTDSTAAQEKIYVSSPARIPGDTQMVIEAAPGCFFDSDRNYVATGSQGVQQDGVYTVTITRDTHVTGYATRQDSLLNIHIYATTTMSEPEGAYLLYTYNGEQGRLDKESSMSPDGLGLSQVVSGGAAVTLEVAYPSYYEMVGWLVDTAGAAGAYTTLIRTTPVEDITTAQLAGALAHRLGERVIKGNGYIYEYEGVRRYFTATYTGITDGFDDYIRIYAEGNSITIPSVDALRVSVSANIREKPVHTITLLQPEHGSYSYELPAGAVQEGNDVKVHTGDELIVTVVPDAKWTVSYWEVGQGGQTTIVRATALRYTFPYIVGDCTLKPIFAATTYNNVSWPTVNEAQSALTLVPEEEALPSVAAGGSFSFRLTGSGLGLLEGVYGNGTLFTPGGNVAEDGTVYTVDSTGMYTISNINQNQIITTGRRTLGITVNGEDISQFTGTGWNYDYDGQVLSITQTGLTIRGSSTEVENLSIQAGTDVGTLTLDGLNITTGARRPLAILRNDASLVLTGNNSITASGAQRQNAGHRMLTSAGELLVMGNGSLRLDNAPFGGGGSEATYAVELQGKLIVAGGATLDVILTPLNNTNNTQSVIKANRVDVGQDTAPDATPTLNVVMTETEDATSTVRRGIHVNISVYVHSGHLSVQVPSSVGVGVYGRQLVCRGGSLEISGGATALNTNTIVTKPVAAIDRHDFVMNWVYNYNARLVAVRTDGYVISRTLSKGENDILLGGGTYYVDVGPEPTKPDDNRQAARDFEKYRTIRMSPVDYTDTAILTLYPDTLGSRTMAMSDLVTKISLALEDPEAPAYQGYIFFSTEVDQLELVDATALERIITGVEDAINGQSTGGSPDTVAPALVSRHIANTALSRACVGYYDGIWLHLDRYVLQHSYEVADGKFTNFQLTMNPTQHEHERAAYALSGDQAYVNIQAENVESLTLADYAGRALRVGSAPIYLVGSSELNNNSTEAAALFATEGVVNLYGSGSLAANGGSKPGISRGDPLDIEVNLHGVEALTVTGAASEVLNLRYSYQKGADWVTFPVGQGWLAVGGPNAARAGELVAGSDNIVPAGLRAYVKAYAENTFADANPATLIYDRAETPPTQNRTAATLRVPVIAGVAHWFAPATDETSYVELIQGATAAGLTLGTDYTWDGDAGSLALTADLLEGLSLGEYTLRVYFYDEAPSDNTYYTLDIPLTVCNTAASMGGLVLTPSQSVAGQGSDVTLTTQSDLPAAAFDWSLTATGGQLAGAWVEPGTGGTAILHLGEELEGTMLQVQVTAYSDTDKLLRVGTARATVRVSASATAIQITCTGETESGDGSYTLYHNLADGYRRSWSFQAAVTMNNGVADLTRVSWSLWGAQMASTVVDAATGELLISPSETGTNLGSGRTGLRLSAIYTNEDGTTYTHTVDVYLSTDAYVAYWNELYDDHGEITAIQVAGRAMEITQYLTTGIYGGYVPADTTVTYVAQPQEGYRVKAWSVNGENAMENSDYTVSADGLTLTLTARLLSRYLVGAEYIDANAYAVTYQAQGSGTITAQEGGGALESGGAVIRGGSVTFTATPEEYWQVQDWLVNGVSQGVSDATLTLSNLDEDKDVTVIFTVPQRDVTIFVPAAMAGGSFYVLRDGEPMSFTWLAPGQYDALTLDGTLMETVTWGEEQAALLENVPANARLTLVAMPVKGSQVSLWGYDPGGQLSFTTAAVTTSYELPRGAADSIVMLGFQALQKHNVTLYTNSFENGRGSLTTDGGDTVAMSSSFTQEMDRDQVLTITAVPEVGSYLYLWEVTGQCQYSTDGEVLTLYSVNGPVEVKAQFRRSLHNLDLAAGTGGSLSASHTFPGGTEGGTLTANAAGTATAAVRDGSVVVLKVTPEQGYMLSSLTVAGQAVRPVWDETAGGYLYTIASLRDDTAVTAAFAPYGDLHTVTAPAPFQTTTGEEGNAQTILEGTVLAGVVADGSSYSELDGSAAYVTPGGAATLTLRAASGYIVNLARLNAALRTVLTGSQAAYTLRINAVGDYVVTIQGVDRALDFSAMANPFAAYTETLVKVTFTHSAGGALTAMYNNVSLESGASVPAGSDVTFLATPEAHHSLVSLAAPGQTGGPSAPSAEPYSEVVRVEQDVELHAQFQVSEYKLTVFPSGSGGGSITINGTAYAAGEYYLPAGAQLTVAAQADAQSLLNGLWVNGVQVTTPPALITLEGESMVQAVFDVQRRMLTYDTPVNGILIVRDRAGEIIPSGTMMDIGEPVIVFYEAAEHYALAQLTVGGAEIMNHTFWVDAVRGNHIICLYQAVEVPVSWSSTGGGSIHVETMPGVVEVVNGQYLPVGTQIRVTATPATGYDRTLFTVTGATPAGTGIYTLGAEPVNIQATFTLRPQQDEEDIPEEEPPLAPAPGGTAPGEFALALEIQGEGTLEVTANGNTLADGDTVVVGTRLTIVPKPGPGMELESLSVNGVELKPDATYEVYANTIIRAVFREAQPNEGLPYYLNAEGDRLFLGFAYDVDGDGEIGPGEYLAPEGVDILFDLNPKTFTDVDGHWGAADIRFVTARELFLGITTTRFDPNGTINRAMFVTVIGRLYERSYGEIPAVSGGQFTDCNYAAYYGKYVDWAAREELVQGYGQGSFGPGDPINRQQMALILYRFARFIGVLPETLDDTLEYPDAGAINNWARDGALFCQTTQIIRGRKDGSFDPKAEATRAETAAILTRFIQYVMGKK